MSREETKSDIVVVFQNLKKRRKVTVKVTMLRRSTAMIIGGGVGPAAGVFNYIRNSFPVILEDFDDFDENDQHEQEEEHDEK